MFKTLTLISSLLFSSLLLAQSNTENCTPLTKIDDAGIKAVIENYRTSWLKDGPQPGVESTLMQDSVLSPAHGAEPVVGMEAIRKFWWPTGGPPVKILQLDISVEEVGGNSCLAYARGHDTVAWSMEQDGKVTRTRHKGTYLNVMKKTPDGSWRIFQHMWDDQPNESF
jgi:ketosteroid isomerase-like protein